MTWGKDFFFVTRGCSKREKGGGKGEGGSEQRESHFPDSTAGVLKEKSFEKGNGKSRK